MAEKTVADITHPDFIESDKQDIQNLINGKIKTFSKERQYIRKDGNVVWARVTVSIVSFKDKKIPNDFIAIVEDITERKQAEEAHLRSEEKYRTIFENVSNQIIYLNKYGTIISANDREKTFGRKPEDIIGKHFTKLGFFNVKDR